MLPPPDSVSYVRMALPYVQKDKPSLWRLLECGITNLQNEDTAGPHNQPWDGLFLCSEKTWVKTAFWSGGFPKSTKWLILKGSTSLGVEGITGISMKPHLLGVQYVLFRGIDVMCPSYWRHISPINCRAWDAMVIRFGSPVNSLNRMFRFKKRNNISAFCSIIIVILPSHQSGDLHGTSDQSNFGNFRPHHITPW